MFNWLINKIKKYSTKNKTNLILDGSDEQNEGLVIANLNSEGVVDEGIVASLNEISTWGNETEGDTNSSSLAASLEASRNAAAELTRKTEPTSEIQNTLLKGGSSALEKLRKSNAATEAKLEAQSRQGGQAKFDEMNAKGLFPPEVLELFPDGQVPSEEKFTEIMIANPKYLLILNKVKGAYGDLQNHQGSVNN